MHSLRWNILLILIAAQSLTAQDNGLTAYWHFDSSTGTAAIESRKQVEDKIQGNFSYTPGVRGDGIKFDGFTTRSCGKSIPGFYLPLASCSQLWPYL